MGEALAAYKGGTEMVTAPDPDYFDILGKRDRQGFDVAVFDDAAIRDPVRMEAHIERFVRHPRGKDGHLRIVFLASPARDARDRAFSMLVSLGVYDLILPSQHGEGAERLLPLHIERPARLCDVQHLQGPAAASVFAERASSVGKGEMSGEALRLRSMAGKRSIGVIAVRRGSGATTIAQSIARSLHIAGYSVNLVLHEKEEFDLLKGLYRPPVFEDGSFTLNGVEVWHGTCLADTNQAAQYTVFDYGVADFDVYHDPEVTSDPAYQRVRELSDGWLRADCKVLVGNACAKSLARWEHVVLSQSAYQVGKWNIALSLGLPSLAHRLKDAIKADSPHVNVFPVPFLPAPLEQDEVPPFVNDVFDHSFGELLVSRASLKDGKGAEEALAEAEGGLFKNSGRGEAKGLVDAMRPLFRRKGRKGAKAAPGGEGGAPASPAPGAAPGACAPAPAPVEGLPYAAASTIVLPEGLTIVHAPKAVERPAWHVRLRRAVWWTIADRVVPFAIVVAASLALTMLFNDFMGSGLPPDRYALERAQAAFGAVLGWL